MSSKYNNKKIRIAGYTFDSIAEYHRYRELLVLQSKGLIKGLEVHKRYIIAPAFAHNGKKYRAIYYEADFSYIDTLTCKAFAEDVKGFKTQLFELKAKLFISRYKGDPELLIKDINHKRSGRRWPKIKP